MIGLNYIKNYILVSINKNLEYKLEFRTKIDILNFLLFYFIKMIKVSQ